MSSTFSFHAWKVHKFHFFLDKKRCSIYFFVAQFCVVNKIAGNRVIRYPQCETVYLKTGPSPKLSLTHVPTPIFLETQ